MYCRFDIFPFTYFYLFIFIFFISYFRFYIFFLFLYILWFDIFSSAFGPPAIFGSIDLQVVSKLQAPGKITANWLFAGRNSEDIRPGKAMAGSQQNTSGQWKRHGA